MLIQLLLRQFVRPGDRVVDATCGNGKDTLLLAELVGPTGHVYALDIQPEALARTGQRLTDAELSSQVTLLNQGHELLATLVTSGITAVIFNLGWLPGGDHALITRPETTLPALEAALQLLCAGGLLAITCYPGHTGGHEETSSVLAWSASLAAHRFHVWRMGQYNVRDSAPFCLVIQKVSEQPAS